MTDKNIIDVDECIETKVFFFLLHKVPFNLRPREKYRYRGQNSKETESSPSET